MSSKVVCMVFEAISVQSIGKRFSDVALSVQSSGNRLSDPCIEGVCGSKYPVQWYNT